MDSGGYAFNPTVFGPPFYEKGGLAPPASRMRSGRSAIALLFSMPVFGAAFY